MIKQTRRPKPGRRGGVKVLCAVLAVAMLLVPTGAEAKKPKSAKDLLLSGLNSGLSSAASWAAEFALNALATGLYAGFCGEDQVNDAAGELLCSVAGGMSGQSEEEWRNEVGAKLDAIQEQLGDVLAGQQDIQDAISRQSDALKQALENLPTRVRVHDDLANIQAAWSAFNEFFATVEPKDAESMQRAMRQLAKDLLTNPKYNVEASARDLRVAIVDGAADQLPLPMLLAGEIDAWQRTGRKPEEWDGKDPEEFDVGPQYVQLELAMRQWLMRQRQAQVLYLWSARVLEGTPDAPRLTAREYGKEYVESLEAQLESFQRAVEWLVLANSFPRSPFANFLPTGAEEVFERADALQAMALSSPDDFTSQSAGQAIWGRVIAMGSGPGDQLTLRAPGSHGAITLEASAHRRLPLKGWQELDWWTASKPAQPLTFDVVHFGREWTVYRFKRSLANDAVLGEYRFAPEDAGNALPSLPLGVTVDNSLSELTGRASERFGSFLGIARAGGAYALFSGDYAEEPYESWGDASRFQNSIDQRKRIQRVDRSRGTMPRLIVGEQVATKVVQEYNPGEGYVSRNFSVERAHRLRLRSEKVIRPGSGQTEELKLRVVWNEDPLGIAKFDESPERVLVAINDWDAFAMGWGYKATYNVRLGVNLGDFMASPANGVRLAKYGENDTKTAVYEERKNGQRDDAKVFLPAEGLPLEIAGQLDVNLPSVKVVRTWTLVAKTSFQTAYLTR